MATPLSSSAIVLKTIDYSDTSLIVRLFTEQHGKVTVIAKGARRPKQSTAAVLQPPNHIAVWYHFKEEREIQTLSKTEYVEHYALLATDLAKSAAALVTVEMLDRAVHDSDAHPILFRLIASTLRQLDRSGGDPTIILEFYQLHLAKQLGFGPQLTNCHRCGGSLLQATLEMTQGILLCERCQAANSIRLGSAALHHLRILEKIHIADLDELRPANKTKKEVDNFLLNHLFFHVDGMSNLKSFKFWRQVQT